MLRRHGRRHHCLQSTPAGVLSVCHTGALHAATRSLPKVAEMSSQKLQAWRGSIDVHTTHIALVGASLHECNWQRISIDVRFDTVTVQPMLTSSVVN